VAAPESEFGFDFDPRFRWLLAALGVRPATARVTVTADHLVARFGPWVCETPLTNVSGVEVSGPYRWYTAIGARGSFADGGLTFGSTPAGGVCVLFHEPVRGLLPFGPARHPGLTVTVADRDGFASTLRSRAGLPFGH
jgi:hypothetical protein